MFASGFIDWFFTWELYTHTPKSNQQHSCAKCCKWAGGMWVVMLAAYSCVRMRHVEWKSLACKSVSVYVWLLYKQCCAVDLPFRVQLHWSFPRTFSINVHTLTPTYLYSMGCVWTVNHLTLTMCIYISAMCVCVCLRVCHMCANYGKINSPKENTTLWTLLWQLTRFIRAYIECSRHKTRALAFCVLRGRARDGGLPWKAHWKSDSTRPPDTRLHARTKLERRGHRNDRRDALIIRNSLQPFIIERPHSSVWVFGFKDTTVCASVGWRIQRQRHGSDQITMLWCGGGRETVCVSVWLT